MVGFRIFTLTVLLMCAPIAQCREPALTHIDTVKQFIEAFNAHDSLLMGSLVTDGIEWLSISGKEITVETRGKANLIKGMDAYFKSCPSCQSELLNVLSSLGRVSAIEVASWHGKNGQKSQQSLSVYEFSEGMISRVYYFPVEE